MDQIVKPPIIRNHEPFLRHQVKSFGYAFDGIIYSFDKGTHFKMQTIALLLVVILGFVYKINSTEWLVLILISSAVISAEATNTAIEEACNMLHPDQHPRARMSKHCAAGAVLILSIAAIAIGLIIFLPKIFA